ncbi:lysozyme [Mesorhizobium sp.]|uniref:lysozyme n=1 Tax=Mesorhizobium sp. TaxID=1871066 RepID=UPI000FE63C3E|nr:lysozyme [Mesorhizobium sp.]RWP69559.1 MAG: glycoside hydrolase [Mesorhizobium sp.]
MPINPIRASKRAKTAIAAIVAMATAASSGGALYVARNGEQPIPAAVALAVDALIIPWEGLVLHSHWDRYARIWDICYGETKGITRGMTRTKAECREMLLTRVVNDYYVPLTKCIAGFDKKPISLQASLISGAYNFGVGAACGSTAARLTRAGKFRAACEAQTAFNRAGGQVVNGLVKRREMGDAQRIGEAELCVSGIN